MQHVVSPRQGSLVSFSDNDKTHALPLAAHMGTFKLLDYLLIDGQNGQM